MKKVLIAYFSASGETQKMAQYIAEGVRFSGNQAVTRKISDIHLLPGCTRADENIPSDGSRGRPEGEIGGGLRLLPS